LAQALDDRTFRRRHPAAHPRLGERSPASVPLSPNYLPATLET
jgi:hypothetical protein